MEPPIPIPVRKRLPPPDTFVLAYEENVGWWMANHCPADDGSTPNDGVTDWWFVGDDAHTGRGRVTHWLAMPPAPGEAS